MSIKRLLPLIAGLAVVITACSSGLTPAPDEAASIVPGESNESTTKPDGEPANSPLLPEENPPSGVEREFNTDFSKHTIPYSEILSGGPPKDGIPAIDSPQFISISEADEWLHDLEPVIVFQEQDDIRIYPLQILIHHEIVNDIVGGRPVTITFCPLCNTAIGFDATVNGQALDFGTTGRLRYSNLLMYDRQTETWWQQATGEAVIGELTGMQLTFLPVPTIGWSEAMETYPAAQVLSRETGFNRPYGNNPYAGYDNINSSPFLYDGPTTPGQLSPLTRVTTVDLNGEAVAYPNDVLEQERVVNDTVGGIDLVVIWQSGLASVFGGSSADGQDVGSNGVFERELEDLMLSFAVDGDRIIDEQTGSVWNVLGQAVSGELEGSQLNPVVKVDHFWFSWAAFKPETRIYQPEG